MGVAVVYTFIVRQARERGQGREGAGESCLKCVNDLAGSLPDSLGKAAYLSSISALGTEADAEASFRHFPRGVNKISIFFSLPFVVLCFVWLVAQIKDKANEGEGGELKAG